LADYACLEKDLLISTSNTSVEIWNPKLYDEDMNDPTIPKSDAYNELAEAAFKSWKKS
jgi:DNA-binding transcriptional regulator/RsmH inhibitor MraZ